MKYVLLILTICVWNISVSQTTQTADQIRQQMAKIRQTTNWDNPEEAKKATEEIKKLARQLTGGQPVITSGGNNQKAPDTKPGNFTVKTAITRENIVAIADRFYQRSYKTLDAISKNQFNLDFKAAENEKFSLKAVRRLTTAGALLITFGNDHHLACVYLTASLKAFPTDTLSANNFGGYLRIIDSTEVSLPVLLYANKLFNQSPVILTQIGCSYFELKDEKKAESYLKEALKYKPDFGQAHTALCELYIKQNRLQDAILELFAGVKGMGCSYKQASGSYAYLKQQADKAGGGNENSDSKEAFWDETRKQMDPQDALAPLVPDDSRIKIPAFGNCNMVQDWMEGGGYISATQAYSRFNSQLMSFVEQFQQVHKLQPNLPPNAILRDYPNERFALDCITEYFFHESKKEADKYQEAMEKIMKQVSDEADSYLQNKERYTKEYVSCWEGCGNDQYCIDECHRKYCSVECPAAVKFNLKLQGYYEDYREAFKNTVKNQEKVLDDLYAFSGQWFSKIQSEYWSRIYAYEIQRVALTIVGNAYVAYPQGFVFPAHNDCGTDCSLYANPYPIPPGEVAKKEPKGNNCPKDSKASLSMLVCSIDLECESFEFGCSAGAAFSIKRNFVNKSTTSFIGVGAEGGIGFVKGEAKAGFTFTKYDSGDTDTGFKGEVSATAGGPVRSGKNYEFTATVMEGARFEEKNVFGAGF